MSSCCLLASHSDNLWCAFGDSAVKCQDATREKQGQSVVDDGQQLILEREAELAAVATAVTAAAAGHGTVILLDGPAGTGKSALLRAATAQAAAGGLRTLPARGLSLEQDFSF